MRILITGGAGFIGSHLAEALLAAGDDVLVIDDLSTGSLENLSHLRASPRLRVETGDCGEIDLLEPAVAWADHVYHLAAAVGVQRILAEPVRTLETNVQVAALVLREAAKKGARVFIASTSEVYGKSTAVPFREEQDLVLGSPAKSRWAYACSKLVDECLALAWARERALPVVIARLFNTVGPRQTGRYGMVLPRFVEQALSGGPITVFGDGAQTRTFTDVGDAVAALRGLMASDAATGEIVNVGGTEEISIRALAERVRARLSPGARIVHVSYEQAYEAGFEEMPRRLPSIEKAKRLVGWEPKVGLDAMIDRVAEAFRAREARGTTSER